MRRVLHQSAVADLGESELAFDHPERVFNLAPDASPGGFNGVDEGTNQGGIHDGAGLEQEALGGQNGVKDKQHLGRQVMLFKQMAET